MIIRTEKERESLREGGRLLGQILRTVIQHVAPGASTQLLNDVAAREMRACGAEPAFLGYHGYPAVLCTSRNDKVVHGIPSNEEVLQEGDIVGLDIGIRYRGLFTDMAVTAFAGAISPKAARLIRVTKESLKRGIEMLRPGVRTGDLGATIQDYVESEGFGVVRDLVGHGVGKRLHEEPIVPNFGIAGKGTILPEGVVIAIEPMVTAGKWQVKTLEDGWSVVTVDGSLTAHFEHTVVLTSQGAEILTPLE